MKQMARALLFSARQAPQCTVPPAAPTFTRPPLRPGPTSDVASFAEECTYNNSSQPGRRRKSYRTAVSAMLNGRARRSRSSTQAADRAAKLWSPRVASRPESFRHMEYLPPPSPPAGACRPPCAMVMPATMSSLQSSSSSSQPLPCRRLIRPCPASHRGSQLKRPLKSAAVRASDLTNSSNGKLHHAAARHQKGIVRRRDAVVLAP